MCEVMLPGGLNTFYARFDLLNKKSAVKFTLPPDNRLLSVSTADVRRILLRVNMSKAAGPDNIPGCVLRTSANQLVDVITDIFNISVSQETVPTCFKTAFEKLVLQPIKDNISASLDPRQVGFRTLPSIWSSDNSKITTPTSECCLYLLLNVNKTMKGG